MAGNVLENCGFTRSSLTILGIMMGFGGGMVFAYGLFMSTTAVRPTYRYVSPVQAWVSMMFAGLFSVSVSFVAVYFSARPTTFRLNWLVKLCVLSIILKLGAISITFISLTQGNIEKITKNIFLNDKVAWSSLELELECCGFNSYYDYPFGIIKLNKYERLRFWNWRIVGQHRVKFYKFYIPPLSCYGTRMYDFPSLDQITEAATYWDHFLNTDLYPYVMTKQMKEFYNLSENDRVWVYPCNDYDVWQNVDEPINVNAPGLLPFEEKYQELLTMLKTNYATLCKTFSEYKDAFYPPYVEYAGYGNGPDLTPKYKEGCKKQILDEMASFQKQMLTTVLTVANEITVIFSAVSNALFIKLGTSRQDREDAENAGAAA